MWWDSLLKFLWISFSFFLCMCMCIWCLFKCVCLSKCICVLVCVSKSNVYMCAHVCIEAWDGHWKSFFASLPLYSLRQDLTNKYGAYKMATLRAFRHLPSPTSKTCPTIIFMDSGDMNSGPLA